MGVCDGILMLSKNLEFITVHRKDSLSDNLAEWFVKATYEEYMEKVNGGIDVTIPVEDIVPIGGGGTYSREQFEKAQELVQQGKYQKLNREQEIEYVRKNIGVIELADKYVKCVNNINNTRTGLHLSTETNGQVILVTVWYIPVTTSEGPARLTNFTIDGATYDQGFPHNLKIQPSGYSILLHRVENSPVSIMVNTDKGATTETIPAQESSDGLGKRWLEREGGWNGIWTRRGNTNIFEALWQKHSLPDVKAVLTINRVGNNIQIARQQSTDGNNCDYVGTIAADGVTVSGTYNCDRGEKDMKWTATISND
ncbi:hypothetical protein [Bacillus cereus]|uniref:Uncharacterized protein n=1 Tax=Bacillus cereus TaxID=1396 RepID=A0A0G8EJA1_BACCE|nr:hypothetical protein [Bacillus cereus]KLA23562.1 hypothetical protein B4077_6149 [Bacillus cereus]